MITVDRILKIPKLRSIEVVAGKSGLSREVGHVTVMEVPDIVRWLKGHDFLITSLYAVKDDIGAQCSLLKDMAYASCACMAVKTGQYVKELSPELMAVADEHSIPLLHIPYDLSYIDIIVTTMHYIVGEQNPRLLLERYIKDIIFEAYTEPELMIERGSLLGLGVGKNQYLAMTLQFSETDTPSEQHLQLLWRTGTAVAQFASTQPGLSQCIAVNTGNFSSVILEAADSTAIMDSLPAVEKEASALLRYSFPKRPVYIGYGNAESGLAGIRNTYYNALYASRAGQIFFPERTVHHFRDIEFHYVMAEIIAESKTSLFDKILDGIDSREILDTLIVYFECNKNIDETAARLYAHKNTIKYRLQRVHELTGLDVKDFNDSIKLYMAVIAYKIRRHAKKSGTPPL
ncbi:PucR family transcriptional regulator [Breznakiella homolactica]|uniref:PucR family transcriptional regulator ligand-binding domain-containing protein n=1 Tax=Breznakiella homolactica TaxID=2798577 RepID=A0A7T8BAD9_9SPIR|nr:PucR family transcriptional regulator [Breznakiella homolactica]QQO10564.1 PucR family transcriptional regulator ligand-binding domain-containing protein [Breznakiella homolactica]